MRPRQLPHGPFTLRKDRPLPNSYREFRSPQLRELLSLQDNSYASLTAVALIQSSMDVLRLRGPLSIQTGLLRNLMEYPRRISKQSFHNSRFSNADGCQDVRRSHEPRSLQLHVLSMLPKMLRLSAIAKLHSRLQMTSSQEHVYRDSAYIRIMTSSTSSMRLSTNGL